MASILNVAIIEFFPTQNQITSILTHILLLLTISIGHLDIMKKSSLVIIIIVFVTLALVSRSVCYIIKVNAALFI